MPGGDRSRSPRDRGGNRNHRGGGGGYQNHGGGRDRNYGDESSNYNRGRVERNRWADRGRNDHGRQGASSDYGFGPAEGYGRVDRRFEPRQNAEVVHPGNYGRQDFQDYRRERREERNFRDGDARGYNRSSDYGNQGRGYPDRGRGGPSQPVQNPEVAEQHRLEVSSRFPNRTFLEEVELPPEFAFRMDNSADTQLLTRESTLFKQKSSFVPAYYRDNMLGASEAYKKKFRTFSFRCKPPPGIDAEGNVVESDAEEASTPTIESTTEPPPKRSSFPISATKAVEVIKFGIEKLGNNSKNSQRLDKNVSGSTDGPKKITEMSIREKTEYYNSELRKNYKNIDLWREFVQFQDQAFEVEGLYHDDGKQKNKKTYNKHLIQKKIAVLDKAIDKNRRCPELHLLRIDYVNEIFKPVHVLSQLKELVTNNQQVGTYWLECIRHLSTQLQIFSSSELTKQCALYFEKLRTMLSPSYPDFQRPEKMYLLLSDLRFSSCLMLKNAGLTERAVAIQQAQLELNFHLPLDTVKNAKGKIEWSSITKLFELFWNLGSLRFGEPEALGWDNVLQRESDTFTEKVTPVGVSDNEASGLIDSFFTELSEANAQELDDESGYKFKKSDHWLYVESLRSKLYWNPYRANASDLGECDDNHRIVLATEVIPFLTHIPNEIYKNDMEKQASYFHSVVQYLQTLHEGFLPRTHTLESVQSPFAAVALTEAKTLFDEAYYWKQFLDLYHTSSTTSTACPVPESFQISEFTLPSTTSMMLRSNNPKFKLLPEYSHDIEEKKDELFKENRLKYNAMIRSIIQKSIEFLNPTFASVLVQMYFRFLQKSTNENYWNADYKAEMKFGKNLMKHEKLRSSTAAYGELGLLEYFSGKRGKACDLLVKTINSTSKLLKSEGDQSEDIDLNSKWETIAEVTKLYRTVAEFHLREQPTTALNILVSLGNNFDTVTLPQETAEISPPTSITILKAKRLFESLLAVVVPSEHDTESDEVKEKQSTIKPDIESDEMSWLHKWDGSFGLEYLLQKANLIVEWTVVSALFRYLSDDFESACGIYQRVLECIGTPEPLSRTSQYKSLLVNTHHIREQLYIGWTKLAAYAVSKDPVQNSVFRNILGKALEEFPCSPSFLLLFTDIESQCSVAGKLWRAMVSIIKQETSPTIATLHWCPLFMCLALARRIEEIERDSEVAIDSFGLGGPAIAPDAIFYKFDALLSAAENNILTRNCPLIWRIHLKSLFMRAMDGKDGRRAHGLFYDGIRHCPTSKALYMDAVSYFPEMMSEVLAVMEEKQVSVRLPLEELDVFLEIDNELEKEKDAQNSVEELSEGEVDDD